MAINKVMLAAIKALSYAEPDLKKNYKMDRMIKNVTHPALTPLYKMWNHKVVCDGREIPIRIFQPKVERTKEILLFFHGGGWVSGTIDSYSKTCKDLANETGRYVVSVDYRLAPEHPFPCAVKDCYSAAKELFGNAEKIEAGMEDIILIGDSAGGNLAAVVSLLAKERGEFSVNRQILIYPSTYYDHTEQSPFSSMRENGKDYLLTSKRICDYITLYIQNEQDLKSPYFAPLLADDLSGQPKTLLITAEYDPLRDEGEAYGEKLKQFGCEVEIYRFPDAIHGFFTLPMRFEQVRRCQQLIKRFLDGEKEGNVREAKYPFGENRK